MLVGVVVGGLASISGALYGALFIQFVPNIADQISKAAPWAIYGIFLIAFMYLMPTGVAGFVDMVRQRVAATCRRQQGRLANAKQTGAIPEQEEIHDEVKIWSHRSRRCWRRR